MVRDALKNYLALASGLTEVGRQRAVAASKALVAQGEATAEQVGSLAEDLIETSKANRDLLTSLVRSEVDKALSRVGLATADEVQRLTRRLQSVESLLREAATRDDDADETAVAAPAAVKAATGTKAAKPAKAAVATKPAKAAAVTAAKAAKPAAGTATTATTATKGTGVSPAKAAKASPAKAAAAAKPATAAKPAAKATGAAKPATKSTR